MQKGNKRIYNMQKKNDLDKIIERDAEINKNNILDAEEIGYKKTPTEIYSYDSFGFLDKYKDANTIQE